MLESLDKKGDYTDEGWLRKIFTDLFQTHYTGEQRDMEGNLTKVYVDEKGNTSVEGRNGWERWLDFLTVITLVREYEQKKQPVQSKGTKPKKTFRELTKGTLQLLW